MDTSLVGQVALVCAASRGLGRAAARALAREGATVAICARGAEALEATAREIGRETGTDVLAIAADVSVPADVTRLVETTVARCGGLDILVTNAGGPPSGPFESLSEQDWSLAIETLLMSVVRLCHAVLPHMRRRGGGRIINITSVAAKQPIDGLVLSNAVRAAVVGLSKSLSQELAHQGILVNCVAPGYTRTDRVVGLAEAAAAREGIPVEAVLARTLQAVPLGRLGEPEELAALVAFLASKRAAYITGTTIAVDGGLIKGLL